MKKILVPCDFSEPAVEAFKFAVEIARRSNGEIILLNVIEFHPSMDNVLLPTLNLEATLLNDLKINAEKNFKKLKTKWAKDDPKVTGCIEYGSAALTISEFAAKKNADLIVMGTKGITGLKEFFAGSNTEKVVRQSPVPVLAVKKNVKFSAIRNIMFPNTLGVDQEELIMKVKALQNFFDARLHILYANTPANFHGDVTTKQQLRDFAKRFMLTNFTLNVFNDLDQESGIMHFAAESGADMIAMATNGRRGLNHLMNGSIAENVVNHVNCPIWTCVEKMN